ncbi:hypothetical protein AKJ37_03345 [candidate division MSBL1 archaeon SCGC-AAA259I09]|uniref:Uncharacterized protein n=2 Tax=candidate division MSBL1 TaxID=215777 RepID=A0A133USZ7_9EURY|nr:hypothetical protein AKJ37_03345 [candidate division MSBL1 archaeon SCGC-AAA259I09]KXA98824.1 hypothetical protein AKJ39_00550 [candidate division MSBL1 archaeon SCGC-AAA259J03]
MIAKRENGGASNRLLRLVEVKERFAVETPPNFIWFVWYFYFFVHFQKFEKWLFVFPLTAG